MRIGIIGTNFISDNMVESALETGKYELSIVCSGRLENAKKFAEKYNIEHYTDQYQNFLDHNLDAVYIAVPNALHFEIAKFFLENRIAVLCEKPMASNYTEVKELIDLSHKNNTLLMEGIIPLHTDGFKALKTSISKIGTIRSAVLAMNQYSSRYDAYRNGEVLNAFKLELSNGSTMDIGIYPLSVAIALFGKPINISASAFLLDTKVDGKGTIVLHYKDKDIIITHSKISNQVMHPEIQGEDGVVVVNHISLLNEVTLKLNKKEAEVQYKDYETLQMTFELNDFEKAYRNQKVEVYEGAHQLSLDIHSILTQAREKTNIVFPADTKAR